MTTLIFRDSGAESYTIIQNQIQSIVNVPVKKRDIKILKPRNKIVTLIGPRRAGKTYLLISIAKRVFKRLGQKQVFYLNLEDERVLVSPQEYVKAIDRFLTNADFTRPVYILLDEVQNLSNWQHVVARIHAKYPKIHLYLTGSNSTTLSSDIATILRGRTISQYVPTLSFREFIRFKRMQTKIKRSSKPEVLLSELFYEYLQYGGFPEVVLEKQPLIKLEILKEYLDVLLFRDIVERYAPRAISIRVLRFLLERLAENIGSPTSINKIYKQLKSLGYTVDKNDLYEYVEVLRQVLFLHEVKKYDPASIKRENTLKKYYFTDLGYVHILKFTAAKDYGKLMENLVFLELQRRTTTSVLDQGKSIFYVRNGFECDFLVSNASTGDLAAIQVSYRLNIDNVEREIKGLQKALQKIPAKRGVLIYGSMDSYAQKYIAGADLPKEKIQPVNILDFLVGG